MTPVAGLRAPDRTGPGGERLIVRRLSGFHDPAVTPEAWNRLLANGNSNVVHLTWHWLASWWETLGRGELLLLAIEDNGVVTGVAPFYVEAGMVWFVGSGDTGYLDFVGRVDAEAMAAVLSYVMRTMPGLYGFRFYAVPGPSRTNTIIEDVAGRLGFECNREAVWTTWTLDLTDRLLAETAVRKKSLVRHENYFRRTGSLEVAHWRSADGLEADFDLFCEQHVSRRAETAGPSAFLEPAQRRFARTWAGRLAETGWLRFSRVSWSGRPIAYHLGSLYEGRFLWHKPSFAIELAKRSPGEVLLRQLLLAAIGEGAHTFDFGTGDDPFKARFAVPSPTCTWGIFPPHGSEASDPGGQG